MKNKLIVALFAFIFLGVAGQAQDQLKIGYTNVDYIMSQLPEAKSIQKELEDYQTQLTTQIQTKVQDFQKRAGEYQKMQKQ